ncbi:MAG: maltose alpha-D-glucosyltransferase [Polyangiales bacterium]
MTLYTRRPGMVAHPQWYKDAVIYECRARSFFDSNGDGVGDLAGLAQKLPYLQDLGVTALWLLPLCPSPGRDDGYDISDYFDVHPEVGTLDDFRYFIESAHRHGIRVITELVLNHTSDAHPWFQRARHAPPGSPERDFYVWSDTPDRYREARIIFRDFEPSNWTWDPVAKAYFWHRFFSHQPDLNFESEAVQQALFGVVDFWFQAGVDGLRLDAVPYLYEEEGSNCENLPRTHVFLKRLRAHIDSKFENRMLLAEANQWPEDAAAYFGDGDECHMNFHFPIMPRMFMAIQMEDRFPIVDIMEQTPQLHENCQWAMFLRNHDELTLEMVTDEERDYMYRTYAHEPTMRINHGIRRRLAPLVGNDRRKMELLNGLLFSLPGTPVLYYGDEIGMGDNVFLGDRNGVRTPMQWSSDRNAGFSRANPQRLILPVIIDPEYHFESLNVEAQQNNPNSLLWWTKRLIALRKRYRAFGWGSIEFLAPSNPRVLAFIRVHGDERILVVANLSRYNQFVELDLSKYRGMSPVELFGRTVFPSIGELPYLLTLNEHAFYWFSLQTLPQNERSTLAGMYAPPSLESQSFAHLCSGEELTSIEEHLPAYLSTRPWYAAEGRRLSSVRVVSSVPVTTAPYETQLLVVRVEYTEGESETYAVMLAFLTDENGTKARGGNAVFALLDTPAAQGVIVDALDEPEASRSIVRAILQRVKHRAGDSEVWAQSTLEPEAAPPLGEPRHCQGSSNNATLQYGEQLFLKVFRRIEEGMHPDLDIGRFLAVHAPELSPGVVGSLELRSARAGYSTLAVLQQFVPNEGTAWSLTRRELGRYYERVLSQAQSALPPSVPTSRVVMLAFEQVPPEVGELLGAYQEQAILLGTRTAQMHTALASVSNDPAFAPEPFSALDRRSLYQSFRNQVGRVTRTLRTQITKLPPDSQELARQVLSQERATLDRFEPLLHQTSDGLRIRCHGDYNLRQALWTGKDFVIVDFDGGSDKALSERRRKRSALRDVASMILSFHYAAETALLEGVVRESDIPVAEPWATVWHNWVSAIFLRAYLQNTEGASFLPNNTESLSMLVERFVLARAFGHLGWELANPSDRVTIPLQVIARIMNNG